MFAAVGGFRYYDIAGGDPYWNNVSFLENFETPQTSFADASTNNFSITLRGASSTPIRPNLRTPFSSGAGASMYYDGSASWMEMPANSAWDLGTGNFTFEAWVYVTNFSVNFGGYMPIMGWGGGSWKIFRVRPTAFNFQTPVPSNLDYNASWPSTMVVNTWYHVALVRSSTTTVTAYLNGVAGTPVTINASASFGNATNVLEVGYKSDPGYWWGYISNWRLVKGTAVYTSNFTPSTSPLTAISGTSGLLNFTNQGLIRNTPFINQAWNGLAVTSTNTPLYAGLSPFGNTYPGSVSLISASAQYLTVATNTAFTYGTGDFTIETWVYFNSIGTTQYIIDQRNSGTANAVIPTLYLNSGGNLRYFVSNSDRILGAATLTTGTWYHVAVCRSGTSTKMFLNGTQDGSTYSDSNNYAASRVIIGSQADTVGNYMNGYASNIRLTNGQALYTTTFTPSTTPLTATSFTSLLITAQVGAFQDLSAYGRAIATSTTNAVISTQQKKFGTQSIAFTATGYQNIANSTSLQFLSSDFTIEGWVYRNASGATHSIICKGGTTTGWLLQINSSNQLVWTSGSTALKTSTTTISATTWTYFAITRSGTTGYMFINGTQEGSSYTDSTNYNQTENMYVGSDRSNANGLNGYLDDIRITKGVARYTSSFTAPTTTFPTS
jgi:hypothetical protein